MQDINLLILDFGLHENSSVLRSTISAAGRDAGIEWMRLVPENMDDGDWDAVLDKLLSAKRSVTL